MPKDRKSNKESKKRSVLTLKEKRAAKKAKAAEPDFLDKIVASRKPAAAPATRRA